MSHSISWKRPVAWCRWPRHLHVCLYLGAVGLLLNRVCTLLKIHVLCWLPMAEFDLDLCLRMCSKDSAFSSGRMLLCMVINTKKKCIIHLTFIDNSIHRLWLYYISRGKKSIYGTYWHIQGFSLTLKSELLTDTQWLVLNFMSINGMCSWWLWVPLQGLYLSALRCQED